MKKKILKKDILIKKLKALRLKKKKIVLSHGVFDLLHLGHIKHFESAKKNGDFLVVSVTSDKYVNKGSGRPVFNVNVRAKTIASLSLVDAVIVSDYPTAEGVIKIVKPDVYYKGPDYKKNKKDTTGNIYKEIIAVKKNKGKIMYSNDITFSSSKLINKSEILFNPKQRNFLNIISKKYSYEYIYKIIDGLKNLRPLVIGETIIDQYNFCHVLGKSGKEPHLVLKDEYKENYLGGAAAISNHVSAFCNEVNFITSLGSRESYLSFIKKKLQSNINLNFILDKDSPTILKKRYIDIISKNKLIGVYTINESNFKNDIDKKLKKIILKNISNTDLIIISDYGHGLISSDNANELGKMNKFISLNAQVNASNYGFHSLEKYKKINTLLINENELRHEMRDKLEDIYFLAKKIKKKFGIKILVVTRGKNGAFMVNENMNISECPAFADKVVDKVGAGDTMLSVISLCLKKRIPSDLTLFLGSLAGANAVENIGNSQILNKNSLLRKIEFILKWKKFL